MHLEREKQQQRSSTSGEKRVSILVIMLLKAVSLAFHNMFTLFLFTFFFPSCRQKEKEQLEILRKHHVEEIEHHKKEIERLQKEIDRHRGKIRRLKHDD